MPGHLDVDMRTQLVQDAAKYSYSTETIRHKAAEMAGGYIDTRQVENIKARAKREKQTQLLEEALAKHNDVLGSDELREAVGLCVF